MGKATTGKWRSDLLPSLVLIYYFNTVGFGIFLFVQTERQAPFGLAYSM